MLSLVRRFLAGVVFVAFLTTGVLTTAKPASAGSNNTWVYVGVGLVVLCFVIPGTPCRPASKTAAAKSRDVVNSCDGTSETAARSLAYSPTEGLGALHTYALHSAEPTASAKSLTESEGAPACASSPASAALAPPGS